MGKGQMRSFAAAMRGRGATDPVASSITPAGRQRNRRVEILLVSVVGAR